MAAAETPAPTVIGAQRVVVACEIVGDVPAAQHHGICEQLVKKARRHTSLPVSLARPDDLRLGLNMRKQADQLLLRVKAEARQAEQQKKTLEIEVTPVRLGRPIGKLESVRSSAPLVQVQGNWIVQGPVSAFEKLLGGSKKPHLPIKSDS